MRKGQKHSPETKVKLKVFAKIRFSDPRNHPNYGKKMSQYVKDALVETHVGIAQSDKQKLAVSLVMKGKQKSEGHRSKISKALLGHPGLKGADNPNWRESTKAARDTTKHAWLRRHIVMPDLCQICFLVPPLDIANVSQEYHYDDPNDWIYLCRACHVRQDGRLPNLQKGLRNGSNTL